jgi:hypothetical protein
MQANATSSQNGASYRSRCGFGQAVGGHLRGDLALGGALAIGECVRGGVAGRGLPAGSFEKGGSLVGEDFGQVAVAVVGQQDVQSLPRRRGRCRPWCRSRCCRGCRRPARRRWWPRSCAASRVLVLRGVEVAPHQDEGIGVAGANAATAALGVWSRLGSFIRWASAWRSSRL